jgi:outer membrane receptor protein involved in Fe transport
MSLSRRSDGDLLHASVRNRALTMTSAVALLSCAPALLSPAAAQESSPESVTVSASRIVRDGFQAPTPTTVVGAADIENQAKPNIYAAIQELPSLMGSQGVESGTGGTSGGTNGLSSFAMRGLGTIRTLTLVDGQRIVPSNVTGVTDISELPQLLIQRVDVVTGGASASWGSDAVAGVVNFIIDKKFTGFKANLQTGISTYGDNWQALYQMAAGTTFGGDRGHIEVSAEYGHEDGVDPNNTIYGEGKGPGGRSWFNSPAQLRYASPTGPNGPPAGQPQYFNAYHGQDFQLSRYGIITTGPLQGIAFAENGQPTNFVYGVGPNGLKGVPSRAASGAVTNCVSPWCIGGDTSSTIGNGVTLTNSLNRLSLYTRVSYDILPNLNVWATAQFGEAQTRNTPSPGSWFAGGQTIFCGNAAGGPNAFLAASVNSACVSNGITSFGFGTVNAQIPDRRTIHVERNLRRYVAGVDGYFNMFNTDWTWNAYAEHGETETHIQIHIPLNPYLLAAQDSVLVTPANQATYAGVNQALGTIVCRSTVAISLGCLPYNPFGNVTPTQATVNWIFGGSHRLEGPSQQTRFDEDVFAINLNGEPLSTWAGPVSFATGFEYRKDGYNVWGDPASTGQCSDPLLNCTTGDNWYAGNFHNGHGAFNVMEGYVETVIPLLKNEGWGSFDLDLGGRATGYSTSGYVNTWKVGATWDTPLTGVRLRGVMSRDIRAPNLSELYSASTVANGTVTNPFLNGVGGTVQVQNVTAGNPNLKPEKAQTTEVGVIYQPDWLPGFSASVDYYRIYYTGGISNLSSANIIELCRLGFQDQCANIITNPAGQTVYQNPTAVWRQVVSAAFNLASTTTDGFDFETSYRFSLSDLGLPGDWTVRLLATHVSKFIAVTGLPGTVAHESAGENGGNVPHWKVLATQSYAAERWSISTTERYISDGRQNTQYVVCTPGSCPASTSNNPTINSNGLRGQFLLDVGGTFDIDDHWQLYGKIDNITNVDPVMIYSNAPNNANAVNPALYDVIGRMYRVGVRLNM